MIYLFLAMGGAVGACSRYWVSQWVAQNYPGQLSYGTLTVNVLGSLLIGVLFVLIHDKGHVPESWKPFLMTGMLGSFTTFSTFSLETLTHLTDGEWLAALMYVVLSLVLCVFACFIGITLTRLF